ncbi:MAG TPA: hypothetical protein VM871_06795 [Flavisolibacter sp.]|nr:hypothetical protein [Flavisolibacter sp.]
MHIVVVFSNLTENTALIVRSLSASFFAIKFVNSPQLNVTIVYG